MRPTSKYIKKKIYRVYKSKKVIEIIKKYHLLGFKSYLIRKKIREEGKSTLGKETLPKLIDYLSTSNVYSQPDKVYVNKFTKKELNHLKTRPSGIDSLEQFKVAKKFKQRLMTRETAKKLGLSNFFSGLPCINNHFEKRSTGNGSCFECVRIRKAKWDAANRELSSARNIKYSQRTRNRNIIKFNRGNRESFWKYKISKLKQSGKRRKISFNLKIEDLEKQWIKQKGRCFYTNKKLIAKRWAKKLDPKLLSVDRIDSKIGYNSHNIVFVSDAINTMKGDYTDRQFINAAKNIIKVFKKRK